MAHLMRVMMTLAMWACAGSARLPHHHVERLPPAPHSELIETALVDLLTLVPEQLPRVPQRAFELDEQSCWLLALQAHHEALSLEGAPPQDRERLLTAHLLAAELVEWTGEGSRPGFFGSVAGKTVNLHYLRVAQLIQATEPVAPIASELLERFGPYLLWVAQGGSAADVEGVVSQMRQMPALLVRPTEPLDVDGIDLNRLALQEVSDAWARRELAWRAHHRALVLENRLATRQPPVEILAELFHLHGLASALFGEGEGDYPLAFYAIADRQSVRLHDLRNAQLLKQFPALVALPLDPVLRERAEQYLLQLDTDVGFADPALVLALLGR